MTASHRTPARELSGITPSGPLTLGNYLGALRRFRTHQDNGYYFVADLHALTTQHDPARLRELTISTAALFLAAGGYHHHLGANTWRSGGAGPPAPARRRCGTSRSSCPTPRNATAPPRASRRPA